MKKRRKGERTKTISGQITWSLFLICILVFIITELLIMERTHSTLWRALDHDLEIRAEFLSSLVDIEDGKVDFDIDDISQSDYKEDEGAAFFLILNSENLEEIGRSPTLKNYSLPTHKNFPDRASGDSVYWTEDIHGKAVRMVALCRLIKLDIEDDEMAAGEEKKQIEREHPIVSGEDNIDSFGIYIVGIQTKATELQYANMFRLTALALGLGLLLLLWTGRMVLLRNLKLLQDFRDEVQGISAKNLKPVQVPKVEEIAQIAMTLNIVMKHLDEVFQRERQFTSNVAHELRTPIAEIRSLAEVVLDYSEDIEPEARENFREILKSSIHLHSILENLLLLSRYDYAQLKTESTMFEIGSVILPSLERIRSGRTARKLSLSHIIPENCLVYTDVHMFQTGFDNLLSNAVEYSPEGGAIGVEIHCDSDNLELVLYNQVDDITEEDLPFLFDRFWRKHRVRSTEDSHSGLGLSIAQVLFWHLGFEIKPELVDNQILRMTISGKRGLVTPDIPA